MTSKPENVFRRAIHKYGKSLPEFPYHMKNSNPFTGGVPDDWYSGTYADLWVEYKFVVLPARSKTIIHIDLSELQRSWLRRRYAEGRNVAVVVGSKTYCAVYQNLAWETNPTQEQFIGMSLSKQQLAHWLVLQTMRGVDVKDIISSSKRSGAGL
jgi:hypothetical protein